jgi:hypothetical protein
MKDFIFLTLSAILFALVIICLVDDNENYIVYDCRLATYPTAVNVPQEVIKKCREKK